MRSTVFARLAALSAVALLTNPTGARSAPATFDAVRFGARCDAVTTAGIETQLASPARAGEETLSVQSGANVSPGSQLYVDATAPAQEIRYVRRVNGTTLGLSQPLARDHAASARVYGTGGYVAGTDDSAAINAALAAAAKAGGGTVLLPDAKTSATGKCAISRPLNVSTSNLTFAGRGMHATTIVAMPGFDYVPELTPRGLGGQYVGMIWTDLAEAPPRPGQYNPPQSPLVNVAIQDLGLDPRAGVQTRFYKYQAIAGHLRAMQHFTVRNVYFELGAPLSNADLTKPFTGINYLSLSYDPSNASHDLTFENIEGHNGVGTVQLRQGAGFSQRPCPARTADRVYNIRIAHERDVVDLENLQDDRIVVTASACSPGATIDGVAISDQNVSIAPDLTSGGANGLKVEAFNAVLSGVQYADVRYSGSAKGTYNPSGSHTASGTIFAALAFNKNSEINRVSVSHVNATYSNGLGMVMSGGENNDPVSMTLQDITLTDTFTPTCIGFGALSAPTGNDTIQLTDFTCTAAAAARARFGNALYGVRFLPTGGVPTNGVSGTVLVRNGRISGYSVPIFVYGGGGFRNLTVDGVSWDSGRPEVDRSTVFRNVPQPH